MTKQPTITMSSSWSHHQHGPSGSTALLLLLLLSANSRCQNEALDSDSKHESLSTPPPNSMSALASSRVVTTQYGKVRGLLSKAPQPGRITKLSLYPKIPPATVEVFYGLQYATVFGGNLRFMPPTSSIEKWEGIKLAGSFQPVCPQKIPDLGEMSRISPLKKVERVGRMLPFLRQQDEECLFLNIFIPYNGESELTASSPLIHWRWPGIVDVEFWEIWCPPFYWISDELSDSPNEFMVINDQFQCINSYLSGKFSR